MIQIILQILKSTQNLRSRDAPCGDAVEYCPVAHSEEKNLSETCSGEIIISKFWKKLVAKYDSESEAKSFSETWLMSNCL